MNKNTKRVLYLLNKNYSLPNWVKYKEPLEQLLITILSQDTNWKNTYRAYRNLKDKFPTLNRLAKAKLTQIESALKPAGLYRQKARTIKNILKIVKQREGKLSLNRLKKVSLDEALEYLLSFPGVGKKTASCVLLFSLDKNALPVDTHILRVSKRLGILPNRASVNTAHRLLAEIIPKHQYLNFHIKMILHGRKICKAINPKCRECIFIEICCYGDSYRRASSKTRQKSR